MTHIQLERRNDLHREHLVDIAVGLQRAHGEQLARDYLEEVKVPEAIIRRILSRTRVRERMPGDEADDLGLEWLTPR